MGTVLLLMIQVDGRIDLASVNVLTVWDLATGGVVIRI